MKKYLLCSLLVILAWCSVGLVNAQNLQFHYDLGRYLYPETQMARPTITATIEQQSVDRFGDTFYFVDMSFLQQGAVSANWKFMRNLRFWQAPVAWHVRYDGGLRFVNANQSNTAISMNDAFMTGGSYTYLRGDRRLMLSAALLYKYIRLTPQPHNFELCTVWKYAPGDGLFSATGFISFWQQMDKPQHRLRDSHFAQCRCSSMDRSPYAGSQVELPLRSPLLSPRPTTSLAALLFWEWRRAKFFMWL